MCLALARCMCVLSVEEMLSRDLRDLSGPSESTRCIDTEHQPPWLTGWRVLLFSPYGPTETGVPSGDGKTDEAVPALPSGSLEVRAEQERGRRINRRHQNRSSPRGGGIGVLDGRVLRRCSRRQRRRLLAHRADGTPGVSRPTAPGAAPPQAKDSLRGGGGGQALHPPRRRRRARVLAAAAAPAEVEALGVKDRCERVGLDPRRQKRRTTPLGARRRFSGEARSGNSCPGRGCGSGRAARGGGGREGRRRCGGRGREFRSGGSRVGVAQAEGPVDAADAGGAAVEHGEGRGFRAAAASGPAGGEEVGWSEGGGVELGSGWRYW